MRCCWGAVEFQARQEATAAVPRLLRRAGSDARRRPRPRFERVRPRIPCRTRTRPSLVQTGASSPQRGEIINVLGLDAARRRLRPDRRGTRPVAWRRRRGRRSKSEEEAVHRCALVWLLRAPGWFEAVLRLKVTASSPAHRYRQSCNRRTYQAIGAAPGARVRTLLAGYKDSSMQACHECIGRRAA